MPKLYLGNCGRMNRGITAVCAGAEGCVDSEVNVLCRGLVNGELNAYKEL
jgi:hypothetical protein